jgi:N-acetylmuramic acid 6-phosphate etherase
MKEKGIADNRAARLLGIEGGGTRTVALYVADGHTSRWQGGPGNVRLMSDGELDARLGEVARRFPKPEAVAIGLAGVRTTADIMRICRAAGRCWPGVPCQATNDLETALAAQPPGQPSCPRVLVLSGTGSCCFGIAPNGARLRVGGWGHVLGDRGSGYEIGISALRAVIAEYDQAGRWPGLGARLLRQAQLNEPEELIDWAQSAAKDEIAALAVEVFAAAAGNDRLATAILAKAREQLVADAISCAQRLSTRRATVEFVLAGSILLKQPRFAGEVARGLKEHWPKASVACLQRESAWGAVELAAHLAGTPAATLSPGAEAGKAEGRGRDGSAGKSRPPLSPTEQRNPRSMKLDQLPLAAAIKLMLSEDARITDAILAERKAIEQVVRLITRALKNGGRLFYVGAGSSGRLGMLDASECPPTFRLSPESVQGVMAGGRRALWESVEGAEDDAAAGGRAMEFRQADHNDVVVGIAASGRTPFVWGALEVARARGAKTVFLCFNPQLPTEFKRRVDVLIAIATGPEILTGSTRLKAGTATKLVLNIFTTLAMVQLGKVVSNLMVDMNPANTKLRDRAVRIVCDLTGADYDTAQAVLENSGWVIKAALKRLAYRKAR